MESTDGAARAGTWRTRDGSMATPCLMLYSRRGSLLNLAPDLRDSLKPEASGVAMSAVQFLENPGPDIVKVGGGVKKFLGMDGFVTLASNRDCMVNEYSQTGKRQTDSVTVTIHTGDQKVTPEGYMSCLGALQPSAFVTLPDELPRAVNKARARTSVERTAKWTVECLALVGSLGLEGAQAFVPVTGSCHVEERERSSQMASSSTAQGFALCGFGCGETDGERPPLITAACKHLPPNKPRFLSGLGSPLQILDAVEAGADIFDSWYIGALSIQGLALHFPIQPQSAGAVGAVARGSGEDYLKFSLLSIEYRTDRSPLLAGCRCFACQNHSRAYIHHLLSVHEMLGAVLLETHNTHHMLQFFAAIRSAIKGGRLGDYKQDFYQLQQDFYIGAAV